MLEHAMALRCAVSARLPLFGVWRASEIAGFRVSDVRVGEATGVVELEVRRQKNDQFAAGQMAHVVALPSWQGACPVQLASDWLRFRSRLARNRNYTGRTR